MITNNHVVEGGRKFTVDLTDGRLFDATLIGADKATDIAVLKIDATGLSQVATVDSDTLRSGDLAFAVDYYEIEVENGVAQYGATNIMERCYDSNPEDYTAGVGFCSLVDRGADLALTVQNGYVNLATDIVKGLDYTARYRKDVGPGSVLFNLAVTQYTEISSSVPAGVMYLTLM